MYYLYKYMYSDLCMYY